MLTSTSRSVGPNRRPLVQGVGLSVQGLRFEAWVLGPNSSLGVSGSRKFHLTQSID